MNPLWIIAIALSIIAGYIVLDVIVSMILMWLSTTTPDTGQTESQDEVKKLPLP